MRDGIISEQMKSRLIKAGLPATYEELVALAADTGIPADILFNVEGWRQLPTYLSKANLLSDATEIAIWDTAKNRTVNDALKMLADVAFGRVATLTMTVTETDGTPIPDVTVRLDSAPTVGEDPITGTDGKIKLDTNAGEHTVYLVYPLGYSSETESKTVQVTGNTATTVASVSRQADTKVFTLSEAKSFYIARFLSPVQFDIRGGGGSGAVIAGRGTSSDIDKASGAAGGYVTITDAIDVAGKLIRVIPGAGGNPVSITSAPSSGSIKTASGNSGGTTTLYVGEQSLSAQGGAGGVLNSGSYNQNGGAYGGAGSPWTESQSVGSGDRSDGKDGRNLFDDSSQSVKGGGGGGAYVSWDASSEKDHTVQDGPGGSGGGTSGLASASSTSSAVSSADATTAGGSGSVVYYMGTSSGPISSGKGGPGFVAFRKAV